MNKATQVIDRLSELHPKGYDLSLDRILRLLERLGNPHLRMPPVVHIAGTNGKGSATAFSRALLEAAGLKVHVHTSPHLVNWHERYRLGHEGGGRLVDDDTLSATLERIAEANQGEAITVFEILTAAMFLLFSEHPADVAVLEVGLGGRFDATNVIAKPAVSLIMPVSLDHQAFLGDTVEQIAFEKAGIIKPGAPVVVGRQEWDGARAVLIDRAEALGCPLKVFGQDYQSFEEHGRLVYQDEDGLLDLPLPRLIGRHQISNAAAAIAAIKAGGFPVTLDSATRAMENVYWPGRLQRLPSGPLVNQAPAGSEIWLDGGHNPDASTVIAEALAGVEEQDSRPLILVAGMINTKDQVGYFRPFKGLATQVYTVPVDNSEASVNPQDLAEKAQAAGLLAQAYSSVGEALELITAGWKGPVAPRILICGSLYLAGAVLAENNMAPD